MRFDSPAGGRQNADVDVEDVGNVPWVTVEFFALFSRLEFALLASGYAGGDIGKNAWVLWDCVAQDLHKSFLAEVAADPGASILFREPARTLIKTANGGCEFRDAATPETVVDMLLQVRTIRNNLFHGSKVYFTKRDRDLVSAGIRVIRLMLDAIERSEKTRRIRAAWGYAHVGHQ
ncbi:hypothetical protein [Rhizobium ruizarguesonis]|uniref:hypothetical protein n=1 Tax=Rhizobium ruizarguesonis TaxID=2081791 RepID=UPI00117AD816|nr:hypothetical protein [Rhizobium ruizarguesonis]UED35957.1 hypothetical protein BSO17_34125 [Rhizobium ruizarguesonis]